MTIINMLTLDCLVSLDNASIKPVQCGTAFLLFSVSPIKRTYALTALLNFTATKKILNCFVRVDRKYYKTSGGVISISFKSIKQTHGVI